MGGSVVMLKYERWTGCGLRYLLIVVMVMVVLFVLCTRLFYPQIVPFLCPNLRVATHPHRREFDPDARLVDYLSYLHGWYVLVYAVGFLLACFVLFGLFLGVLFGIAYVLSAITNCFKSSEY